MKSLLIAFTLFFTVNLVAQNETVETPKIAIKVAIGKTIQLKNHSIKFIEVLEDSRCPEYVNCIWAGRARISVEIKDESDNIVQKELLFGQTKPGEIVDNTLFSNEDSNIKGLTLSPYPNSEKQTEKDAYRLLIEVDTLKD
ncbi:MAG: hypothetical protein KUG68_08655 [Flavobacteriaceae bacterium]|nr:hypothetical protein [Flavobacteriaceae bacterium]